MSRLTTAIAATVAFAGLYALSPLIATTLAAVAGACLLGALAVAMRPTEIEISTPSLTLITPTKEWRASHAVHLAS